MALTGTCLPPACPGPQYPELPEPVMDKLLALEANELDMVLQYPQATRIMVRAHASAALPAGVMAEAGGLDAGGVGWDKGAGPLCTLPS